MDAQTLEVFKVRLDGGFGQSGLVKDVPDHGRGKGSLYHLERFLQLQPYDPPESVKTNLKVREEGGKENPFLPSLPGVYFLNYQKNAYLQALSMDKHLSKCFTSQIHIFYLLWCYVLSLG